jgi:hypothetical protein
MVEMFDAECARKWDAVSRWVTVCGTQEATMD